MRWAIVMGIFILVGVFASLLGGGNWIPAVIILGVGIPAVVVGVIRAGRREP